MRKKNQLEKEKENETNYRKEKKEIYETTVRFNFPPQKKGRREKVGKDFRKRSRENRLRVEMSIKMVN